jgi:hypothetical protein
MIVTILVVILVLYLIGGIGPWSPGGLGYGYGTLGLGGPVGVILVIIVVLFLMGRL